MKSIKQELKDVMFKHSWKRNWQTKETMWGLHSNITTELLFTFKCDKYGWNQNSIEILTMEAKAKRSEKIIKVEDKVIQQNFLQPSSFCLAWFMPSSCASSPSLSLTSLCSSTRRTWPGPRGSNSYWRCPGSRFLSPSLCTYYRQFTTPAPSFMLTSSLMNICTKANTSDWTSVLFKFLSPPCFVERQLTQHCVSFRCTVCCFDTLSIAKLLPWCG